MNEFESDWISESKMFWLMAVRIEEWSIFCHQNGWIEDGRFQVWAAESDWRKSVFEWIWEKITRCLNPRWQLSESNMAEFKMAAIIKLSQNEWVKYLFVQNGWIQDGRLQDGCHHQVESEWMSEVSFCARWLNSRWQNSRWLQSSSWVRMNEWSFFVQMVGTNLGKCEWVWEDKLRWLNPRLVEFKFKMAAIIKLSQNEWVKYFLCKWWEPILASLSEFERKQLKWLNPRLPNSRWLPSSSWVRMNEWSIFCAKWLNWGWQISRYLPSSSLVRMNEWRFFCANVGTESWQDVKFERRKLRWLPSSSCQSQEWMTLSQIELVGSPSFEQNGRIQDVRIQDGEYKMAAIIKISENEWLWVRLN